MTISQFFENHPMMLFGLEAGMVLFLLISIVIWTMSGAKKYPRLLRTPPDHPSRHGDTAKSSQSTEAPPKDSQAANSDAP